MLVEGNIGEEVYVKATIKEIHIVGGDEVKYTVEIDQAYDFTIDDVSHQVGTFVELRNIPQSVIKFPEATV